MQRDDSRDSADYELLKDYLESEENKKQGD